MNYGNDSNGPGKAANGGGDMDDIGRLIRHGGAREPVPAERFERSREKVRGHWEQVVREQRSGGQARPWLHFARAAGLVAVLGVAMVLAGRWLGPDPGLTVASIERVVGALNADGQPVAVGASLVPGSVLNTGTADRAALRLANGQSLRIDVNSELVLHAPDRLALARGALYIDTDGADEAASIRVETPLGSASDIGTQFQVRIADYVLVVGVRQGAVEVDQEGRQVREVNAGHQVMFAAAGAGQQEPLDPDDPQWAWIETVAPEFDLDGASLAEYLAWYAREQGLELVWADGNSRARAENTNLAGSLEGVSTRDSLAVVQRVAPFEYRSEQGSLWVRLD